MPYNLTDKQMQVVRDLVRLCQASQHKSFSYTPTFNNRDTISAHGTSVKADCGERDLRTIEVEGMIGLRWVRHGAANGTVLPRAFEAVKENFGLPPQAPAAAVAAAAAPVIFAQAAAPAAGVPTMTSVTIQVPVPAAAPAVAPAVAPVVVPAPVRASAHQPVAARPAAALAPSPAPADPRQTAPAAPVSASPSATPAAAPGGEILYQLSRSIADLSATFREAMPLDEAEAAEADATAINRQLHSRQPDAEVVARRTRSIMARVGLAMGGGADLADKHARYADALRKLASFVSLVGQWAAAHRRGG